MFKVTDRQTDLMGLCQLSKESESDLFMLNFLKEPIGTTMQPAGNKMKISGPVSYIHSAVCLLLMETNVWPFPM